jgi:hypothetical protein
MQIYPKEHNAAATFVCDEKTWRKWTRIYAKAVARLVGKYVSTPMAATAMAFYQQQ